MYKLTQKNVYSNYLLVVRLRIIFKILLFMCFLDFFFASCIFSLTVKIGKQQKYLIKYRKRNTNRLPLSISPLQTRADGLHHMEQLLFLLTFFYVNRIKYYLRLDLLEVCLDKDGTMCSLQLQRNGISDKLMREERNRPLKMSACH